MERKFHKPNKTQLTGASLLGVGLWTGSNTLIDIANHGESQGDTSTMIAGSAFWLAAGAGTLIAERAGFLNLSKSKTSEKPQKTIEESLKSFIDFHKMVATENYRELKTGREYSLTNVSQQHHLQGLLRVL